jgi:hypothetical protein
MPKKIRSTFVQTRKEVEKDIARKVGMFDLLPEECTSCSKDFDKNDVHEVSTWYVVADSNKEEVRLFCPPCWENVTKAIKDIDNKLKEMKQ